MQLTFIRDGKSYVCWDYYETKTNVVVFGDREGYDHFCALLRRAERKGGNTHVSLLDKNARSMRVVILPARTSRAKQPELQFIERLVFFKSRPRMELVVYGNQKGYRYLAERIKNLSPVATEPSDYYCFDDLTDSSVLRRSVAVTFRAPLAKWSKKALGVWEYVVLKKNDFRIPEELRLEFSQKEDYSEISAQESDFLIK